MAKRYKMGTGRKPKTPRRDRSAGRPTANAGYKNLEHYNASTWEKAVPKGQGPGVGRTPKVKVGW